MLYGDCCANCADIGSCWAYCCGYCCAYGGKFCSGRALTHACCCCCSKSGALLLDANKRLAFCTAAETSITMPVTNKIAPNPNVDHPAIVQWMHACDKLALLKSHPNELKSNIMPPTAMTSMPKKPIQSAAVFCATSCAVFRRASGEPRATLNNEDMMISIFSLLLLFNNKRQNRVEAVIK